MKITTKISFKQYVKLLYSLAYEKIALRFLICFAFIILLWIIFYHTNIISLPKPLIYQYITLGLIAIVQPILIFITIRSNYYSSNQLMETLVMELSPDIIKINGESYYMEIKWDKLFKIVEKQNWFLLYQNNLSAIIIPKKDMSETDINNLRTFLNNTIDVPLELLEMQVSK